MHIAEPQLNTLGSRSGFYVRWLIEFESLVTLVVRPNHKVQVLGHREFQPKLGFRRQSPKPP